MTLNPGTDGNPGNPGTDGTFPLDSRESYGSENKLTSPSVLRLPRESRAQAMCIAAANRGWMSEKVLPPGRSGKVFSLDIHFDRTRPFTRSWPGNA